MRKYRYRTIMTLITVILIAVLLQSCTSVRPNKEGTYEKADVSFSREAGAWAEDSFSIQLLAPKGYTIYYTLDGSVPDRNSRIYRGRIKIKGNGNNWLTEDNLKLINLDFFCQTNITPEMQDAWIVRAVAYAPDGTRGNVITKTYFPGTSFRDRFGDVMVVSIVTDPANLLDYDTGILVKGKLYDEWIGTEEAQRIIEEERMWEVVANYSQSGKDWEKPASVEIFDLSEILTLQQDCGIRIHGGAARAFTHRSFRLYFKEKYGTKYLNYQLFPENISETTGEVIDRYDCIILRNGGNMADSLVYKDGWQQTLLSGLNFSTQNTRPAVIYLNGEYWGVCAVNDRYNEKYIEDHFGVNDLLLIKDDEIADGNEEDLVLYENFKAFSGRDFSDTEVWTEFCEIVDIQNMADYFAAQIYMANPDCFYDKNTELWRSISVDETNPYADGKWRFMMYDTEMGSGCYEKLNTFYEIDSIHDLAAKNPVFGSALGNEEFRRILYDAIERVGSETFSYDTVESTIGSWDSIWRPLLEEQRSRFKDDSRITLDREMRLILEFYRNRYEFIIAIAEEMLLNGRF